MKGSKKKTILLLFTVFIVIAFFKIDAYAAPNSVNIPEVNVSIGDGNNTPQDYVSSIKILIFFYNTFINAIYNDNAYVIYQNSCSFFFS